MLDDPRSPGHYTISDDWPEHAAEVAAVHTRAFARPDEAELVAAVRASCAAVVSLAAFDGPDLVAHVLLSPVTIDGRTEPRGLGLGPVAVRPDHQRRGCGTQLIEASLQNARMLGYAYVVVLGHPQYYPRFGFQPAGRFGLRYELRVPDDVFMALELRPGSLDAASGVVHYSAAFSAR